MTRSSGDDAGPDSPVDGYGAAASYAGGYGSRAELSPQTEGRAVAALVLAIVSVTVFPIVPALAALVVASGAHRAIEQSQGRLTGYGLITAARIVAWIGLVLGLVAVVLLVVAVFVLSRNGFS